LRDDILAAARSGLAVQALRYAHLTASEDNVNGCGGI
jgi:hypothetical protein